MINLFHNEKLNAGHCCTLNFQLLASFWSTTSHVSELQIDMHEYIVSQYYI